MAGGEGGGGGLPLTVLHTRRDLFASAATLLSSTWPRSQAARVHTFEQQSDALPLSLVFTTPQGEVYGHAMVSEVVNTDAPAVLIESVIIHQDRRKQGLGRRLMSGVEQFAKERGYGTCHLSTHDKQAFYERCGYSEAAPVSTGGSAGKKLGKGEVSQLLACFGAASLSPTGAEKSRAEEAQPTAAPETVSSEPAPPLPPPPPPPPPPPGPAGASATPDGDGITWMKKVL